MVTKLIYFELQEVISDYARSRQIVTYSRFALFVMGNDMVTELYLTFVYWWLLPSKRKAK